MFKIAVLISGRGSNLASIIENCHNKTMIISMVISNNDSAQGILIAKKNNITTHCLDSNKYGKENFEDFLYNKLSESTVDLIILAGFMLILSKKFIKKYEGKIINIHPSLLPKYRGLNTHKEF